MSLLVLTIALAQGVVGTVALVFNRTDVQTTTARSLPSLSGFSFTIGTRVVTGDDLAVLLVTMLVCVGGGLFFRRSKFGVAIRAAAENADAARLVGISPDRVSTFVWVVGALLAGVAGILITQVTGTLNASTLSIGFLVRGLTAALIGGLTSLPGAVAGGLFVGIAEYLIKWRTQSGLPEAIMFVIIVAVLLFRPGGLFGQREETADTVAFVPTLRELPARLRNTAAARGVQALAVVPVLFVVLISLVTGSHTNDVLTLTAVFAMVGVSLTVLMGYTGQISLGHWGLAGVGAFSMANLYTKAHVPYLLALPMTVVIGMAVSLIVGIPALRIRGLYLAVVTLAFNLAAEFYIFKSDFLGGTSSGIPVKRPSLGPFDLDAPSRRPLFFFTILLLGLVMLVGRNLARSRTGRGFFAVRENEKAAATFGVSLSRYKLLSFVISGGIAALAGALYATRLGQAVSISWGTEVSLTLVSIVVIGGIGSLYGSVLGAFLVIGFPQLANFSNPWIVPIGTGALLLIVIVRVRGGLAGLVQAARERLVALLVELSPPAPSAAPPSERAA